MLCSNFDTTALPNHAQPLASWLRLGSVLGVLGCLLPGFGGAGSWALRSLLEIRRFGSALPTGRLVPDLHRPTVLRLTTIILPSELRLCWGGGHSLLCEVAVGVRLRVARGVCV
jgi:hypothetical protein